MRAVELRVASLSGFQRSLPNTSTAAGVIVSCSARASALSAVGSGSSSVTSMSARSSAATTSCARSDSPQAFRARWMAASTSGACCASEPRSGRPSFGSAGAGRLPRARCRDCRRAHAATRGRGVAASKQARADITPAGSRGLEAFVAQLFSCDAACEYRPSERAALGSSARSGRWASSSARTSSALAPTARGLE